jgi:hypothetical protein
MSLQRAAALLFTILSIGVIAFQIALAAGAPWGAYAMGGASPGQFPPSLRIAAIVQAAFIAGTIAIVLVRAEVIRATWVGTARKLVWAVVALGTVSLVLNLITPSASERTIWAPVAALLLLSSVVVAMTNPTAQ